MASLGKVKAEKSPSFVILTSRGRHLVDGSFRKTPTHFRGPGPRFVLQQFYVLGRKYFAQSKSENQRSGNGNGQNEVGTLGQGALIKSRTVVAILRKDFWVLSPVAGMARNADLWPRFVLTWLFWIGFYMHAYNISFEPEPMCGFLGH